MNVIVLSFLCAFGLLSFAQFLSVDPKSRRISDGEITAETLNVRSGPGISHDILTVVPHGTQVAILEFDDGWARIAADNDQGLVSGWVSGKYVDIYEIALPRVASAGIGEESEDELPVLPQPTLETVIEEILAPTADDEIADGSSDTTDEAQTTGVLDETLETEEPRDIQISSIDDEIMVEQEEFSEPAVDVEAVVEEQPISSEPPQEVDQTASLDETTVPVPDTSTDDPLSFKALDISCRRGYFADALEACTADIKVDVELPVDLAGLVGSTLNVKCEVGFTYETDGETRTDVSDDVVLVNLIDGKGSAVLQSHIDFLFRVDDVTRVEVGEINCGGVN